MKIGVIGAGNIGGTIGARWAARDHEVFFGVRDPQKASLVEKIGGMTGTVHVGTSSEAIASSDVVVLAVPGASVGPIVDENLDHLRGKTIIDASNNMRGLAMPSATSGTDSRPRTCTVRSARWVGKIWPSRILRGQRQTCFTAAMKAQSMLSMS